VTWTKRLNLIPDFFVGDSGLNRATLCEVDWASAVRSLAALLVVYPILQMCNEYTASIWNMIISQVLSQLLKRM
jgi:hypothetical protein